MRIVREIAKNYDQLNAGVITVSKRGGKYHIIDGRHRITAAIYGKFPRTFMFDCRVLTGLTYAQEAELFARQDENKTRLTPSQEFNGLLEAENAESLYIQQNLKRIGLEIDTNNTGGIGRIACVRKAQQLYRSMDASDFFAIMDLVYKTWDGDPVSLKAHMIGGCALFHQTYKGEYNEKTFIKKLNAVSPVINLRDGYADSSATGDLKYAKQIHKKYNHKLSEIYALPYKFLG